MAEPSNTGAVREAVGVFDDAEILEAAIDELLSSGFDRSQLSLLAGEETIHDKLGHIYAKVEDVEDDPEVPRAAYVSTEARGDAEGALVGGLLYVGAVAAAGAVVATGGTLAAAIAAAAAAGGAGGAVGAALAHLIEQRHADYIGRQVDHGGLVLWARLHDEAQRKRAMAILTKHSAHDVHEHTLSIP